MRFRRGERRAPTVDLTPLIDVVFLLLIFFMVSTTFERHSQIKVKLPESSAEVTQDDKDELRITIDRAGGYYVNQDPVNDMDMESLMRAVEALNLADHEVPVVIDADARATHQSVITAMDALSRLGFVQINFATRQPDPK